MHLSSAEGYDFLSAFQRQRRVLYALMLRNIRTRFFGSGLGYLIAIAWPLSHILIVVILYFAVARVPPYGDSIVLFVATGVVPFQIFNYLARFMMIFLVRNHHLLAFGEVKVLDMLFASALLEILAAFCVTIVLMTIAWFFSIDIMPNDVVEAALAFGAAVLMGLGFGLFNGVLVLAYPGWFTSYTLISFLLWVTSGILFVPDALPEKLRNVVAYHPVLQVIVWMRSAYYEGYSDSVLNRSYTISYAIVTIFMALIFERAMRGYILARR